MSTPENLSTGIAAVRVRVGPSGLYKRYRYRLRTLIGRYPVCYFGLSFLWSGELVKRRTDLVIEGFPRSGNTFAVAAFRLVNPESRVARHTHVPAQVIRAERLGIPTMVLIRPPVDACSSLVVRAPYLRLEDAFKEYTRYYKDLLGRREELLVVTFEELTSDFGNVIDRVNERFGTGFQRFDHTERNVRRCFKILEEMDREDTGRAYVSETQVARPSKERDEIKSALIQEAALLQGKGHVAAAEAVFREFTRAATA